MTSSLFPPALVERRSDERQVFGLINALRLRAMRSENHFQSSLIDFTTAGTVTLIPQTGQKFITHLVDIVIVGLSGVHTVSAVIGIGTDAGFSNLVTGYSLSTGVVVDQVVGVSLVAVVTALSGDIVASWTAASGAGLVLTGYLDITGYWQ